MKYLTLMIVLFPMSAFAHAQLEETVPPVGSTVSTAAAELEMHFSEGVEPRFCKVAVTGASGASVNNGALHGDPADAKHLLVPVSKLVPGVYTVTWHAVSVDTHRTQGSYHFTVSP